MPPAGFEPTIPASERPQTHTLDSTATWIGTAKELHFVKCLPITALSYVVVLINFASSYIAD